MLLEDESQYWGDHTIGPHGKCKEVFHGAVKEHDVKVLWEIGELVNLYEERRKFFFWQFAQ